MVLRAGLPLQRNIHQIARAESRRSLSCTLRSERWRCHQSALSFTKYESEDRHASSSPVVPLRRFGVTGIHTASSSPSSTNPSATPLTPTNSGGPRSHSKHRRDHTKAYKRIIVCCDGTGKAAIHGDDKIPTNAFRFAQALSIAPNSDAKDGTVGGEIEQILLYQSGVGTDGLTGVGDFLGKTFGHGVDRHLLEAYHFFVNNFDPGDQLFLFGFSRGAFTARAIASFIVNVGLLKKRNLVYLSPIYEQYKETFRPDRRDDWDTWFEKNRKVIVPLMQEGVVFPAIGLWDTVGSLGLPTTKLSKYGNPLHWMRDKYAYHDMTLSLNDHTNPQVPLIQHAFQALALDERRISFSPTVLATASKPRTEQQRKEQKSTGENYPIIEQCWFPGVHTDVGGGYKRGANDVSDLSLAWMVDRCTPFLSFRSKHLRRLSGTPTSVVEKGEDGSLNLVPDKDANKHELKSNRWGLSKLNDEYVRGLHWKIGGSEYRTPGEYFLGKKVVLVDRSGGEPVSTKTSLRTNEYMHPSVRARLIENLAAPKDPDWETYLPPALKGFRLRRDTNPAGWEVWMWVKTVTIKNEQGEDVKEEIAIPELWIEAAGEGTKSFLHSSSQFDNIVANPTAEKMTKEEQQEKINKQLETLDNKSWWDTAAGLAGRIWG